MADRGRGRGKFSEMLKNLPKFQETTSKEADLPLREDSRSTPSSNDSPQPRPSSSSGVSTSMGFLEDRLAKMSQRIQMAGSQDTSLITSSGVSSDSSDLTMTAPKRSMGRGMSFLNKAPPLSAPLNGSASIKSQVATATKQLQLTHLDGNKPKQIPATFEPDDPIIQMGTSGTPLKLLTNYIRLNVCQGKGAFEYVVSYDPPQDFKLYRIKMLKAHKESLGGSLTFDGNTLYLPILLPKEVNDYTSSHPDNGSSVKVTVKFIKKKRFGDLRHVYNVLFKRIMSELEMVDFGRQYFDPKASHIIPQHKLEVWPGYVTAVDEYEDGLMLCLDPLFRVLHTQSVLFFIKGVIANFVKNWEERVKAGLIGQSVITKYHQKVYVIDDVAFDMNPNSTFTTKQGDTTFLKYYKHQYGLDLMDFDQPMLITKNIRREAGTNELVESIICLVPELCYLTGLSEDERNDFHLMKELSSTTRITPNQRFIAMKKFITNVNNNKASRELLSGWGLSICPSTVELTGRLLAPENIIFRKGPIKGSLNVDWNRDITSNQVIMPIDIHNWAVLYTQKDEYNAKEFTESMQRCGPPMGIQIARPQLVKLHNDKTDTFVNGLKNVITPSLQVVVCICPTDRDDRYSAIKKVCCSEKPVASQVINGRTLNNKAKVYGITQKIALQINCKLGGSLWTVNMPLKNTMIMGLDCFHSPVKGVNSIVGFVASMDQHLTRWYSLTYFQKQGQEIVDGMKTSFTTMLHQYHIANGDFPSKILIYRDGVGDGQINACRDYEVPQLESCFATISAEYKPTLTFVVVQKRIKSRIFSSPKNGPPENPPPGTVVDNTITRRNFYDFFIVPQKVRSGTVTPTHYIVVSDTSGLLPDQLQRLTYKLCHMYYNWPGTVRCPAPCVYAHRLASLIGKNVRRENHHSLNDKLFYL